MPENSILSPVSLTSYFDNATGEARQANLFFYKAGTLDPVIVYTDAGLTIPYPQPVATTGWGRVPPVYVGEIPAPGYRVRTFDQYQTLIEDLDGLPGALPTITSSEPISVDQTGIAKTGDVKLKWSNHNPELGWVEITKGGTIGNGSSNASLMAHTDAHALFLHLWQQDAVANTDVALPVIPSKGASAQGDWDANKQISVPDARGRLLGGFDQVDTVGGGSMTKRLDAGLFNDLPNKAPATKMVPWLLGASGGESVHKLVVTELAVHKHDWIDYVGHTHFLYDAGHNHGVSDPGHLHPFTTTASDSDGLVGRTNIGADYWLGGVGGTKAWTFVGGDVGVSGTGLTVVATPNIGQSHTQSYMFLINSNHFGTGGGAGQWTQWIGTWSATDGLWHQATEFQPRPSDYAVAAERGDIPHNNLPPFLLFAIFMKL